MPSLLNAQKFALADGERHVHRVLAYDDRQRPGFRLDDVPLRDVRPTDLPSDGCENLCVAKVDLGRFEIGLVDQNGSLGLFVCRERLVSCDDRADFPCQQILGAAELNFGQKLRGVAAIQRAFRLTDRGFEKSVFDTIEGSALGDQIAFLEFDGFEISPLCGL